MVNILKIVRIHRVRVLNNLIRSFFRRKLLGFFFVLLQIKSLINLEMIFQYTEHSINHKFKISTKYLCCIDVFKWKKSVTKKCFKKINWFYYKIDSNRAWGCRLMYYAAHKCSFSWRSVNWEFVHSHWLQPKLGYAPYKIGRQCQPFILRNKMLSISYRHFSNYLTQFKCSVVYDLL